MLRQFFAAAAEPRFGEPRTAAPVFARRFCVRPATDGVPGAPEHAFGQEHWDNQLSYATDARKRQSLAAMCARINVLTAQAIAMARELAHGQARTHAGPAPRRRVVVLRRHTRVPAPAHAQDHADLIAHMHGQLAHTYAPHARDGSDLLRQLVQALTEREQTHAPAAAACGYPEYTDPTPHDMGGVRPAGPCTETQNEMLSQLLGPTPDDTETENEMLRQLIGPENRHTRQCQDKEQDKYQDQCQDQIPYDPKPNAGCVTPDEFKSTYIPQEIHGPGQLTDMFNQ